VRKAAANLWSVVLRATGGWVEFPFHGETIRLCSAFRSWNLDYESAALHSFLELIAPGDVVWDIGANIGIYTIMAGKRVGPAGKVVCWEPHPKTVETLGRHVGANGLQERCEIIPAAVSDGAVAQVSFRLEADPTTSRMARSSVHPPQDLITTQAKSLDEWRQEFDRQPRVVKVDVEGAEALVLRGGSKLLSGQFGSRPLILVAVHPQFLGEFGCKPQDIEEICGRLNYLSFDLQRRPAAPVEYAEYWLVPRESIERFA
jgi:FkbM family methyltransferase